MSSTDSKPYTCPEYDPAHWKEQLKDKSFEEKEAIHKQHEHQPCCKGDKRCSGNPIWFAIFLALDDDDLFVKERRDREMLLRLSFKRVQEWCKRGFSEDFLVLYYSGTIKTATDAAVDCERRNGPMPKMLSYPEDADQLEHFRNSREERDRERLRQLSRKRQQEWFTKADFTNRLLKGDAFQSHPKGMCSYFADLEQEFGSWPGQYNYPADMHLLPPEPECDPEHWKEKFKNMSNAEIDNEIGLYKMMSQFAPDKFPEYTAILKALEDNEPYQVEKREQERLSDLRRARVREWNERTGYTACIERVVNEAKANGTHASMDDVMRVCGVVPFSLLDGSPPEPTEEKQHE